MSDLLEKIREREWFYDFELPDGSRTSTYHSGQLSEIHATRWHMLKQYLDSVFSDSIGQVNALDLASHQGWFAVQLAQSGVGKVHGIEARASHVDDSRLISEALGLRNVRFTHSDIFDLDVHALGSHRLVLMFGLLYHVENPVGALRLARALCSGLCVIETQIVPGMTGLVDFGSYRFVRPLRGTFGVIDETEETHGPETGVTGICLVPSLEALMWLIDKVGFRRAEVLSPPEGAYEQLLYGKRVMVVAHI